MSSGALNKPLCVSINGPGEVQFPLLPAEPFTLTEFSKAMFTLPVCGLMQIFVQIRLHV